MFTVGLTLSLVVPKGLVMVRTASAAKADSYFSGHDGFLRLSLSTYTPVSIWQKKSASKASRKNEKRIYVICTSYMFLMYRQVNGRGA